MGVIVNRRRVYGGKKLPYDAEIEYLESSGTQWIDTGIIGIQPTDEFSMEVARLSTLAMVYGWKTVNRWYDLNLYHASWNQIEFAWGEGGTYIHSALPNIGDFHLYHASVLSNRLHFFVDNIDVGSIEVQTENNTMHGYLFGRNENGSIGGLSPLKIKNFTYKRSGEYIIDFIPVRVGTIGYMYDKVSGQLFGNAGTGEFILGPDK